MGAFRDLLKQAHEKGLRRVEFTVNLDRFFADEQDDESWCAESGPVCGYGRTGEEALRFMVEDFNP